MELDLSLYRTMLLIRRFEERLLEEFSTGRVVGTTHTYIGQEADAAGIFSATLPGDVVFSNHRCHGHFLAYGGDPYSLVAELMGKATGLVGGRGGSQHIHWKNFYSNGIQGGIVPISVGIALAEKVKSSGNISIVFMGDGTLGEGVIYESLNIARLWALPVLFVVENNRYAQTTPVEIGVIGNIASRFSAFQIPVWEIESSDVLQIRSLAIKAIDHVREQISPAALIIHTYRFAAHSKGDDPRSMDELERIRQFDPLLIHGSRIPDNELGQIGKEVGILLDEAFRKATSDPLATLEGNRDDRIKFFE